MTVENVLSKALAFTIFPIRFRHLILNLRNQLVDELRGVFISQTLTRIYIKTLSIFTHCFLFEQNGALQWFSNPRSFSLLNIAESRTKASLFFHSTIHREKSIPNIAISMLQIRCSFFCPEKNP